MVVTRRFHAIFRGSSHGSDLAVNARYKRGAGGDGPSLVPDIHVGIGRVNVGNAHDQETYVPSVTPRT